MKEKTLENLTQEELDLIYKKSNSSRMTIFILLIVVALILGSLVGTYFKEVVFTIANAYCYVVEQPLVASEATKEETISKIEQLVHFADEVSSSNLNIVKVKSLQGFVPKKDRLPLVNTKTETSGGLCLGISMYEKMNYLDTLKDLNIPPFDKLEGIDLDLNKKDDLSLYFPKGTDKGVLWGGLEKEDVRVNTDITLLYKKSVGYYTEHLQDLTRYMEDNALARVLNTISALHYIGNKKVFEGVTIKPYISNNLTTYSKYRFGHDRFSESFTPELITQKIDQDIPVVIAFFVAEDPGHAVMAYKYEELEGNIVKVYVSDSNLPLLDETSADDKAFAQRYNQDVNTNGYILFHMNEETHFWEYIYNPVINTNYFYRGEYNSYIPGTTIRIFD